MSDSMTTNSPVKCDPSTSAKLLPRFSTVMALRVRYLYPLKIICMIIMSELKVALADE